MGRNRGGGSSASSRGVFAKKAAPAPTPAVRAPPPQTRAPPARAPPPPAQQHHAPPPAPHSAAPVPAPSSGGGMMSGLGGMVAQGMAIGTGSAIAHQAVNGIMGSFSGGSKEAQPQVQQQQPTQYQASNSPVQMDASGVCSFDIAEFNKCLKEQNGNAGSCQYYYDALRQCQENAAQRL